MTLKAEQVKKFIELHKDCGDFSAYSEEQKNEIANGVANYYLTLFSIHQRNRKENKEVAVPSG